MGISEEKGTERLFKEITDENSLNLGKESDSWAQKHVILSTPKDRLQNIKAIQSLMIKNSQGSREKL